MLKAQRSEGRPLVHHGKPTCTSTGALLFVWRVGGWGHSEVKGTKKVPQKYEAQEGIFLSSSQGSLLWGPDFSLFRTPELPSAIN